MRSDVELFRDAYAAEFASFVDAVRSGGEPYATGVDARYALAIALACIESYKTHRTVLIEKKRPLMPERNSTKFPLTL